MISQQAQTPRITIAKPLGQHYVPAWKRILDTTMVLIAAPLWLPISVFVAILIKSSSGLLFCPLAAAMKDGPQMISRHFSGWLPRFRR